MSQMITEVEDFIEEIYPHINRHDSGEATSKIENEDEIGEAKRPVLTVLAEIADWAEKQTDRYQV